MLSSPVAQDLPLGKLVSTVLTRAVFYEQQQQQKVTINRARTVLISISVLGSPPLHKGPLHGNRNFEDLCKCHVVIKNGRVRA